MTASGACDRAARADRKEAAGARLSVEHDPAGHFGARRAGGAAVKRPPHCLHAASRRFVSLRGGDRVLHYMCKSDACTKFQEGRGLTRPQGGAYGVVGFSGVKDARRASSSPTLQRRPAHHARIRRSMDKPWTNTGQTLCIYGANLEHLLSRTQDGYKLKTRRLQKDCMSTARGQHFESKRTADR